MHPTFTPHPLRRLLLLSLMVLAAAPAVAAEPAAQAPKLVVVLVVDGLPQEQLQRYRDQFAPGGLRRLLEQGASYGNAHQAHGITLTAVGHAAILSGAYPYQHGIIGNHWIDPLTRSTVYCAEDRAHTYIGEETKGSDGTSPVRLRVDTLGDALRYATGNRAKVLAVSGKDRGAIMLAGKTGTAYMYMDGSGNFASSTYYMAAHPAWVTRQNGLKLQDSYYGKSWTPLLADAAYAHDASDDVVAPAKSGAANRFPFRYASQSGKPDAAYYLQLKSGPAVDELTLAFARAAIEGEGLGRNPAGVPDLLGISLSGHDYVNHAYGPESRMSHDHLQRLDRMVGEFLSYLDQRLGLDQVLVVLTADHGFSNVPEFSQGRHIAAQRLDSSKLVSALDQHLAARFGLHHVVTGHLMPNIYLDYLQIEQKGLRRDDVENAAARFLLGLDGVAQVTTRSQMESGAEPATRLGLLMRRAWNRQLSGDLMLVPKPFSYFGSGSGGTTHGTPYAYDTNVPLIVMGKPWIVPGAYGQYAEVVDLAPTLAHLLRLRPPAASEGRVLVEALRK